MGSVIPDLTGKTIKAIRSRQVLKLWTSDGWLIRLAGTTTLKSGDRAPVILDTQVAQLQPIPPVVPLVGRSITGVTVSPQGDLEIEIGDLTLHTDAAEGLEAWEISGPNDETVICMPGGELAESSGQPTSPAAQSAITVPDFRGEAVTRISLSNSLKIFTSNDWMFSLEGVLWLTRAGRQTVEIEKIFADPVEPPEQLADLVGEPITGVLVSQGGHLAINFARAQISVEPRPEFEAWQIHGARGELIVCGPGGRVTGWGPADS